RGHLELLREALPTPPIVGGFPRDDEHVFPERHLGLFTAEDDRVPDALFDRWGALAATGCSMAAVFEIAKTAPRIAIAIDETTPRTETRCRRGGARDGAFHFSYADTLARLEALGAELVPFSPIHDAALPP